MARTCTVCVHKQVSAINAALLGNEAYRSIAKRFGASESAVYRHQQEHIPATMMKSTAAAEVVQADSLMDKITQLEQEARRLGKKAEDAGDLRAAMAAVRELVRIVELLAKIQGELKEPGGTTVNVVYVNAPSMPSRQSDKPLTDVAANSPTILDLVPEKSSR